jgi:hypothetical protein
MVSDDSNEDVDDSGLDDFNAESQAASPVWRTLVKYSDVYGKAPFEGQLLDVLSNVDCRACVQCATWFSNSLRRMTRERIGQESLHCFRNFFEPETARRICVIIESSNSTILTAPDLVEQVGFARLLVSDNYCQSADPLISFGAALLIINEIAANSATEPVTANLSGSLRNILRAAGNERMLAYRYLKFREWSRSKMAQCSKNYIDIDAIFESSSGISLDDFFAATRLYAGLADRTDIEVNREAVMPLFHTDWAKLSGMCQQA